MGELIQNFIDVNDLLSPIPFLHIDLDARLLRFISHEVVVQKQVVQVVKAGILLGP